MYQPGVATVCLQSSDRALQESPALRLPKLPQSDGPFLQKKTGLWSGRLCCGNLFRDFLNRLRTSVLQLVGISVARAFGPGRNASCHNLCTEETGCSLERANSTLH